MPNLTSFFGKRFLSIILRTNLRRSARFVHFEKYTCITFWNKMVSFIVGLKAVDTIDNYPK